MSGVVVERKDMHWMYFLALEEDLLRLARYVEFSEPNFGVFSIECARLLLAACSEVDVVLKLVAESWDGGEVKSLFQCRQIVMKHYPLITEADVSIPRHGLRMRPWASWELGSQPTWWEDYNAVKHRRSQHYAQATLRNALEAIAGLMVVLLMYLHRTKAVDIVMPATLLLRPYFKQGSYCVSPEGHLIDLRSEDLHSEGP